MAINHIKIKFPCGLEIESYSKSIRLSYVNTFDDIKECPLHKKKCKEKRGKHGS